jgi:hypothetical protein
MNHLADICAVLGISALATLRIYRPTHSAAFSKLTSRRTRAL